MANLLATPIEIYRDDYIKVLALDEKGAGGAHHQYGVYPIDADPKETVPFNSFQEGPIGEVGVNGYTNEALFAIGRHRLECFQKGKYPCDANQVALDAASVAIDVLEQRTAERKARGVEGKSIK